jgi:hypothetical protein
MTITTYRSPMLKRTMLVASQGRCGHKNYIEYQIVMIKNTWTVYKTDGYSLSYLKSYDSQKSLKSVINLVWGM